MKTLILAISILAAMACAKCSVNNNTIGNFATFKCTDGRGTTNELFIDSFNLKLKQIFPDKTSEVITMGCSAPFGDGDDDSYRRYRTIEKFDRYGIRTSASSSYYTRYSTCRDIFSHTYKWFKSNWNL